jgi:hypothetical protein
MIRICRQVATTALAVMILSSFPLAQGTPAQPSRAKQQVPAAPSATVPAPTDVGPLGRPVNAEQVREQWRELLDRHPPSLGEVLRLDPTLLTNADYMAPYPDLAGFLAQHPEIAHNPAFYVGTPNDGGAWDRDPRALSYRMWENILQGFFIASVFLIVTGVLVWLVRTVVDYRRWLRLTKVQTDTHTKLLDRLTSQDDLLAYMQTPAGRRFLESAPITLDPASRPLGAPLSRVLWSVQAGVVLALGGLGVLYISRTAVAEVEQGLRAIGILALALGAGFMLSAAVAYLLSSRLGLFDQRPASSPLDPLAGPILPRSRD